MPSIKVLAEREERGARFTGGHTLCAGCAEPMVVRTVLNAIEDPVVVASPTGCLGSGLKPLPRHGLECALDPRGLRKRRRRNFRRGSGLQSPTEKRKNLAAYPVRCFRRRWRNLRYRPSSAFRSPRARPRFPLRLPQQRGLHEHRGSAFERNPKIRLGHHCALWRGYPWKAPEAEGSHRNRRSPTAFPMWPRLRYPTSSISRTKWSGP
jgi:hypothetical protein